VGSMLWDPAVDYTGVDPLPFFVERARDLYGNSRRRFMLGEASRVPVDDESCDAAFSIAVWHLLRDLAQPARELHRVLRPGGHFLLITANPDARRAWASNYVDRHDDGPRFEGNAGLSDGTLVRETLYFHPVEELAGCLRHARLSLDRIETFRETDGPGVGLWLCLSGRR
jgi:SAM-dependent methyltransferase